jgi:hypothetical protein
MPLLSCLCALNFPILDIAKPDGVRLCLQLRSEPRKGDNRRLTSPVQPDFHIRGGGAQHSSEAVSRRVGAAWKGSALSAQRTAGRYAEALVAVWDQKSNGSRHMVHRATELELGVLVVSTRGEVLSLTKEQPPAG